VADLQVQGVPIEGEAGVGYRLGKGFELPPLMFTAEEAQALVVMSRLAQQWLDPAMAQAGEMAVSRVLSVMTLAQRERAVRTPVYSPPWGLSADEQPHLQIWREASQTQNVLRLHYRDAEGHDTERTVRPLGSFYWGKVWTLVGWCEQRAGFRSFRLDRVRVLHPTGQCFVQPAGQRLIDYLRGHGVQASDLQ
jgi:predicted DNA-binding transcriptional regulator YafY